ncbi:MAG: hypothetical protein JWL61_2112 [Gemmatimonadetes bacterium]|nr:hypothetical protein [Gemmatimonadota bacterium]
MRPPIKTISLALMLLVKTAGAQSRTLYTTPFAVYNPIVATVQNGAVTSIFPGETICGPLGDCPDNFWGVAIAVGTDVRTIGQNLGSTGREYTLGGSVVGPIGLNSYPNTTFRDGTTDGTYNYSVDIFGTVWRGELDWSNMMPLFSTGIPLTAGITYDWADHSIWVGELLGVLTNRPNTLFEYALNGTLMSSFTPNVGGQGITALAYDAVDQTLWFGNDASFDLFQYSRTGTPLSTVAVSGTNSFAFFFTGAEFQNTVTPEPASLMLMATGLLAIGVVGRRARRA